MQAPSFSHIHLCGHYGGYKLLLHGLFSHRMRIFQCLSSWPPPEKPVSNELLKEASSETLPPRQRKAYTSLATHSLSYSFKFLCHSIPATEGWGGPAGWHGAEIAPHKNVPAMLQQLWCCCNAPIKSRNICRGSCWWQRRNVKNMGLLRNFDRFYCKPSMYIFFMACYMNLQKNHAFL